MPIRITIIFEMKLIGIIILGALGSSISREEASNFLVRSRRGNDWAEEILKSGNLERECIEEFCDFIEFIEACFLNLSFSD